MCYSHMRPLLSLSMLDRLLTFISTLMLSIVTFDDVNFFFSALVLSSKNNAPET